MVLLPLRPYLHWRSLSPVGKFNMQKLSILGSTGSIGQSTLAVVSLHPDQYEIYALTANSDHLGMLAQVQRFAPAVVVMREPSAAEILRQKVAELGLRTEVLAGESALEDVSRASEISTVVAAIVGAAGLAPTLAAVKAGKRVLLANKESLVMAGQLFMDAVDRHQSRLLPVDSEHNAIFQCLPQPFVDLKSAGVRRLLLTGSGGPFRRTPLEDLAFVTPEQACAHPNWAMGKKISVDSATMMNKGLEFIEACWLFGASPDQVEVVVHPQSIVHSMVEFLDGSTLAQMGQPDMRTPIAHCLGWPIRIANEVAPLNFFELGDLSFERPDFERFPCLKLAMQAFQQGGTAPAVLNAVNEVAVESFLSGRISFNGIAELVDAVMQNYPFCEPQSLDVVIQADHDARAQTNALLKQNTIAVL
jgi:1-deoxy-D-xylulose-5-phosphate reductoisomerase